MEVGLVGVFGFDKDAEFFLGSGIADQGAAVVSEGFIGGVDGGHDFGDLLQGWFFANRHVDEDLGILGHAVGEFSEGFSGVLDEG